MAVSALMQCMLSPHKKMSNFAAQPLSDLLATGHATQQCCTGEGLSTAAIWMFAILSACSYAPEEQRMQYRFRPGHNVTLSGRGVYEEAGCGCCAPACMPEAAGYIMGPR